MSKIKRQPKVDGTIGWFELSPRHQAPIGKKLDCDKIFDFAIIGGGFTGLSVAHRLAEKQPNAKIAVIDALNIGEGTSGRNAGFIIDVPHNVDGGTPNLENDLKFYQLNLFAIERLRQWKQQFSIDCDWCEAGKYMAAHETNNLKGLDQFVEKLKACNFAYEDLNAEETQKRLGTSYYQRSIYTPGNILINPAALVRGIAAGLPKSVSVFEKSPVTNIEYGKIHRIETVHGIIHAGVVVQATNAFNEEFGQLKHRIAPVYTYASLTQPLSQDEHAQYFKNIVPWGLTSAHGAGTTVRYTTDGRIFIRNILQFSSPLKASDNDLKSAIAQHRRSFDKRFSKLSHIGFDYSWGGMIAVTRNHDSVFYKPASNILILNGCNGVGIGKGTYLGFHAADYLLGDDNADIQFIMEHSRPSFIPPDPMRRVIGQMRLKKEQRVAGGDV